MSNKDGLNSTMTPTFEPPSEGYGAVSSFDPGTGSGGGEIHSALDDANRIVNTNMSGNDVGLPLTTLINVEGDRGDAKLRSASDSKFPT